MTIVSFLSPKNLAQEKERFFASKTYHPQLTYRWDEPETQLWIEKQTTYKALVDAVLARDTLAIIEEAKKVFATELTIDALQEAHKYLEKTPKKLPTPPVEKVVEGFKNAFSFLGLDEFEVEVSDSHGFNFRPNTSKNTIEMSKHLNMEFFSIDGEVKHELVHILRYVNGKHNDIVTSRDYLPTEEGLACYCQDYLGENGEASLFQHAVEYTMTEVALKSSFRELTEYLQEIGFSAELAWQRGIRHKYGWEDTSQPGDIMKPSMYFYHEQKIRKLTDDERERLFVGKITQSQLPQYPDYVGRLPLDKLREFYKKA